MAHDSYLYGEGISLVPGDALDFPGFNEFPDLNYDYPPPPSALQKPAYRPSSTAHAAVPALADIGRVKPEPVSHDRGPHYSIFDYDPHVTGAYRSWSTMAQYPPSQPLTLSQPPTPGAECLVSSTISPLASPFTPRSEDGSFEDLPGPLDAQALEYSGDLNIKGMTEEQLVSLSARDLNRLCRDMPDDVIKQLKKRRRTLKNRGYAYNSRVRRVSQKNTLEKERDELKLQLSQLSERCRILQEEKNQWKRRAQALERGEEVWSPDK